VKVVLANPEEGKIKAMREFITYCRDLAKEIGEKSFFKNDMINNEIIPFIGFSDDDPKNIEKMNEFLYSEYEKNPVRTYLTKGGEKKKFNYARYIIRIILKNNLK
jgi:hypothetical protein